jgi:hypothetical protein
MHDKSSKNSKGYIQENPLHDSRIVRQRTEVGSEEKSDNNGCARTYAILRLPLRLICAKDKVLINF